MSGSSEGTNRRERTSDGHRVPVEDRRIEYRQLPRPVATLAGHDQRHDPGGQTDRPGRILAEPPSDYQRWELWAARWHADAGEQIGYLSRSQAVALGLPTNYDWWLLDEQAVIVMRFDETGRIAGKELVTDPGIVARHREWRDVVVRHAIPAEEFTAA